MTHSGARRFHPRLAPLLCTALVAAIPHSLPAATLTKANNADPLNLSSSWVSGIPGGSDIALFNNTLTSGINTNLGANLFWKGLQLTNPLGAVTVLFDGNTLTLDTSGIDLSTATQNLTLNNNIQLAAGQDWTVASSRTLTVNGNVSLVVFTLHNAGGGSTTINGSVSGSAGVLVSAGLALYNTSNTFIGPVTIDNGALLIKSLANGGSPSSLGQSSNAASNLIVRGGLYVIGASQTQITDRLFTLTGTTSILAYGGAYDAGVNFTNSAPLINSATASMTLNFSGLTQPMQSTFSPQINDPTVGVTSLQIDSNVWLLNNSQNGYTGATNIPSGTLAITALSNGGLPSSIGASSSAATNLLLSSMLRYQGSGSTTDRLFTLSSTSTSTLDSSGTGPVVFSNTGSIAFPTGTTTLTLAGSNTGINILTPKLGTGGTVYVTKSGTGTWVLVSSNTSSGTFTINAGTLLLDFSASSPASIISASSPLALAGGALQLKGAPGATTTQSVLFLNVNSGASSISFNQNGAAGLTLALHTMFRSDSGAVLDFTPPSAGAITTSSSNSAGTILGAWATTGSGTSWANVTAGSIQPLAAFTSDTWSAGSNTTVTANNSLTDATTNSLRFAAPSTNTLTLAGTNVISSGGLLVSPAVGAQPSTITGGNLTGGSGKELIIQQFNTTSSLTLASNITDNGGTSFTKAGPGVLYLSGTNTYTGNTNIVAGTVVLGSSKALPVTPLSVNGALNLNGNSLATSSLTLSGTIDNRSAAPVTLTLLNGQNRGSIQNTGGPLTFIKNGTSTFFMYARATYTGETILNAGLLTLTDGTAQGVAAPAADHISPNSKIIFNGGGLTIGSGIHQDTVFALANSGESIVNAPAISNGIGGARLHIQTLFRNAGATINFNIIPGDPAFGTFIDQINAIPTANTPSGILNGWTVANFGAEFARLAPGSASLITNGATYSATYGPTFNTDVTLNIGISATSTASLRFKGGTLAVPSGFVVDSGGILVVPAILTNGAINSGSITSGNGTDLIVHQYNTNASFSITSVITDNGATSIGLTKTGGGILALSATNTYTGTTYIDNGTLQLQTANAAVHRVTGNGTLEISPIAVAHTDGITATTLSVKGTLVIRPDGGNIGMSKVANFTLAGATNAWTAKIDLSNNTFVVQSTISKFTTLSTLANQINTARNGGLWNGNGITSSTVAADPSHYDLGLFDNAVLNKTVFNAVLLDTTAVIVAPALIGDANLDTLVNSADLTVIANHWHLNSATNWAQGDLNSDHIVDSLDVALILAHWDPATPFTPQITYSPNFSFTLIAVPEPSTLALLMIALPLLRKRRSHNHNTMAH